MAATTQRIIPILVYADIAAAQEFLVNSFGFTRGDLHRDHSQAVHGEVSRDGETIWLHRVNADHGLRGVEEVGASTGMINVFVDDVDAHHARSVDAGVKIIYPPTVQPYGQREYGAVDLEGRLWSFATRT
ncbi:MAG: VOC family protein [Kofleriaceae bacterium]